MGATPVTAVKSTPVKTIFDTDMQSDCDDCGALATLHKLADLGEADILACVVNSPSPECAIAATVDAINIYYGRPQIPIGTYHVDGRKSRHSAYTAKIRDEFPHAALPDDQEPTALSVYRTALAAAPNSSVTIISVGFFTNLYDLLKSPPDAVKGADMAPKANGAGQNAKPDAAKAAPVPSPAPPAAPAPTSNLDSIMEQYHNDK